jgi:hypothetical protein
MLKWIIAAVSWFLAYSVTLHAEQRALYTTASFLGRGGAMVADTDDYNAIFVNPAGLSSLDQGIMTMELQLESSMGLNNFLTAYFGYDTHGMIPSQDSLVLFRDQNNRAKLSALTAYTKKDFGLGLFIATTIDTDYSDDAIPTADVYSAADVGAQISFSHGFLEKEKLKIGMTAKSIFRIGKFGNMDFTALNTNGVSPFGASSTYGVALASDIGAQYTWFQEKYNFSLGLSGLDLGTPFLTTKEAKPAALSARLVVGAGLKIPNIFKNITLGTNLDLYKSFSFIEGSVFDYLHFGLEIKFPQFLSIRGGFNQMYWTAGLGIKYWLLEVDFTTYADNIWTDHGGRKSCSRRYLFQAKVYF